MILKTCIYIFFSIGELIEFNLNKKTFIYYPNKDKKDMFSFYYLDRVNNTKKNWVQDCRLEKLTVDIQSDLIPYCVDLYRKIYYNIFHDNIYREDMSIHSPLINSDCEQILYNIIFISDFKFFNNYLRKLISEKFIYIKTPNDTFNLLKDDILQKPGFSELQTEKNICKNVKLLYENISENILDKLVQNKLKNFDLNISYK